MENQNNQVAPDNYMIWAILSTLFCCLPLGIVSIIYASKVNGLWYTGNCAAAVDASRKAKKWALVSMWVAIVCWLVYVISMLVVGGSILGFAR